MMFIQFTNMIGGGCQITFGGFAMSILNDKN